MVKNPPENFPRCTPYLLYRDSAAALDFLTRAFGFKENLRIPGPDGTVGHAELGYADAVVMLGTPPDPDFKTAKERGGATASVYLYVDDVDKHYQVAKEAGATIIEELSDKFYGDRTYTAEDPEGQQWSFGQHTRDVPEDELAAAAAQFAQGT